MLFCRLSWHYVIASFLMASRVFSSSVRDSSMSSSRDSTRCLSYPICTRELMSDTLLVFFVFCAHCFFEKSIDHLRSTIIFWAVFFPIHGTLEMSLSSSSCMACTRVSFQSQRSESAVFHQTPLTFRSSRKRDRSSRSTKAKSTSLMSVLWWWIQVWIIDSHDTWERRRGEASTSSPRPVHSMRRVRDTPSIERILPEIYEYMSCIIEKRYTIATMMQEQVQPLFQRDWIISVDILLSVVDNYWDIGFATELMISLDSVNVWKYFFRIFTDNPVLVTGFLEKNKDNLGEYHVFHTDEISVRWFSAVIFLLFHHPLPKISDTVRHIILRIDYLSFDPVWTEYNGHEHILSTPDVPIIEIIPSFLSAWSGILIPVWNEAISKQSLLWELHLPIKLENKKWISLFVYPETLDRIDFGVIPEGYGVFILWWGRLIQNDSDSIFFLPFLSIEMYHRLMMLSDMNLVRWEVSAVTAMMISKPYLWDMYKWRGWFPLEMSQQFLDFFSFSSEYAQFHREFNTAKSQIPIKRIIQVLEWEYCFRDTWIRDRVQSLSKTIEKYIDRFYFSL